MAKVTGPLMSMDARGKIADSLVFIGWKGIQTVRQFIIPANPDTDKQKAVRAHMTLAVARWHDVNLTADDKEAWDAYASLMPKPMSGFNTFVRTDVLIQKEALTPIVLHTFGISDAVGAQLEVSVSTTTGKALKVYWGTKKTKLDTSANMVEDGSTGVYEYTIPTLPPGVTYFAYCIVTTEANAGSRTGILGKEVAETE